MKKSELKQLIREGISKVLNETVEVGSIDLGNHKNLWIYEIEPEDNDSGYIKISTGGSVIWIGKEKLEEFKSIINKIK